MKSIILIQKFMMLMCENWFFVASYVVTDKNKLNERGVDNDIPHWEGLEHVKNSLFRSRQSRGGTLNSRRVLTPHNVYIIVHIPWDELIFVRHYIQYNTKMFHNFNSSVDKKCPHCLRWGQKVSSLLSVWTTR